MTFRLYDWDHIDAKTGHLRPLQVDQAIACIDFAQGAIGPVAPVVERSSPVRRELLFCCEHFGLSRIHGEGPFVVGAAATPRVLVCIAGEGQLEHAGTDYAVARGDVFLLPAVVGACCCRTSGTITLVGHFAAGGERKAMKKLVVFDLDGTLAESKSPIDAEMAALLSSLLGCAKWPSSPAETGRNSKSKCSPISRTTDI